MNEDKSFRLPGKIKKKLKKTIWKQDEIFRSG